MIRGKIFKDKCEICNQFRVCKGYREKVLCNECIEKIETKKIEYESKKEVLKKKMQMQFYF